MPGAALAGKWSAFISASLSMDGSMKDGCSSADDGSLSALIGFSFVFLVERWFFLVWSM